MSFVSKIFIRYIFLGLLLLINDFFSCFNDEGVSKKNKLLLFFIVLIVIIILCYYQLLLMDKAGMLETIYEKLLKNIINDFNGGL